MCGIAGFIRTDGAPADLPTITTMTNLVAHRGPNGAGFFMDGVIAFGHRRLSVLDLSEHGSQPMYYSDGNLILTYNGEIYNYIEIRKELTQLGYGFRSETDSEVILAAYQQWGEGCVSRFNGMWAFALFDKRKNIVFLSRDRFGVKPLYYLRSPTHFAFGSEIRQLVAFSGGLKAESDAVRTFLVTAGSDLDASTFFSGISKLQGGYSGIYDLASGRFRTWRYYELSRYQDFGVLSAGEATERFGELLADAVRLRLRSDVKVGTCLSGGLDSSSIATLASRLYRASAVAPFSAVTAISEQEATDESAFAETVVAANDLSWYPVKPTYRDFVDSLGAIVDAQEEPFSSPSLTMQYFVMKTARENGITVLLDGQGGDEILLGYERYYVGYIVSIIRKQGISALPAALRGILKNNRRMNISKITKYAFMNMSSQVKYSYYKQRSNYLKSHSGMPSHVAEYARYMTDVFEMQKLEIGSTNLPALLRYEDKNSMAHGIETRLPFLDYRVVELSLSLPENVKIRDGWTKWILRQAMSGQMPDKITWRRDKLGFNAPENSWLESHLPEISRVVASSPLLNDLANMKRLLAMVGKMDGRSVWRLYSVALWEQAFKVGGWGAGSA